LQRSQTLYIFTLLLMAGGGMLCAADAALAIAGHAPWPALRLAGVCSLVCGAVGGVAILESLRRTCGVIVHRLRRSTELSNIGNSAGSVAFPWLSSAIGEVSDAADQAIADAKLRAKELEIQLKVATAERQHAEAIIYSISDAVLVTDPFDELVLANESAARTFEFDLVKSAHSPVDQVLRDPRMIDLIREMRQSHSRNGRRIVEHEVRSLAGGGRTFKITLSSVTDGDAPAGVVAVLHDVTREKEVSEMKNDFVSMVSHELRTPLASIRAYIEMLIDGEAQDAKTQHEFYEVIQNESNRLGRLIDNILNISRIESGLVRINKQPQSLAVVLKDAIDVIGPQATQKQIKIEERLPPVFYQTLADRDMLYQAVLNLLSNAVKYTPNGGTVTVEASAEEGRKKVLTRIIDTGVGIPPKDMPFIFDKFYRSEANNRMASGTGLGLSLVKHIIETVHHGRMLVESHVGKGSSFGFELDLCE
jgi:two-component system, OmpR family, phosphate regulon sensor histidine kinase PhoR